MSRGGISRRTGSRMAIRIASGIDGAVRSLRAGWRKRRWMND